MKSVLIVIGLVLLLQPAQGRAVSKDRNHLFRASVRVAKHFCEKEKNSDTWICGEFLSLLENVKKHENAGTGTATNSTASQNKGAVTGNMFGNPGISWRR